jgi:6-phosphofructokinase
MSKRPSPKKQKPMNAFYAQSGGVSAVINASAAGVIEAAMKSKLINKVYAGRHGIVGALTEDLIDVSKESRATIKGLRHTPAGAFGSARYKLKSLEQDRAKYERLIEVFKAHDIGYFFYNGGNDSMDTANKVSQIGDQLGHRVICVGVPKTVDNDLPHTDCTPGFGSVAKYVAISTREAALDVASMAKTSTKVFVMEVMGRHAGWIVAAAGLAGKGPKQAPHIILFPEIAFDKEKFLARVKQVVSEVGYCVVVVSEGVHDADGKFLADIYSAPRGTSPRKSTRSRPTPWARPRSSSPYRATTPSCPPSCARSRSRISGWLVTCRCPKWRTSRRSCRATTSPRMASASRKNAVRISNR